MTKNLNRLSIYLVYLFLAWGSFRFFVRLPEVVEELWLKPLIWLVPLFWWRLAMKKKLSLFGGDLVSAVGYGLGGGLIYFVVLWLLVGVNMTFDWNKLGIAAAMAIVEEMAFSGVILSVLVSELKREGMALGLMALSFASLRLPINIFVNQLPLPLLVGAFLLAFFVALINGFLRLRSNNVLAAMLAHFVYLVLALS